MTTIEQALHDRLKRAGRVIASTTIPDEWVPDAELVRDAQWLESITKVKE